MPKFKKVKKSLHPTKSQLENIPYNLNQKLNVSVRLGISIWKHDHIDSIGITYKLSFVPGLRNEDCTQFDYTTWSALIDQYHFLMGMEK